MNTINPIELLMEARKYTNRSVSSAFISLADRLAGYGQIKNDPDDTYNQIRCMVQFELDGCLDENREKNYEFTKVSDYANDLLTTHDIESEEELLQGLVCAGILAPEDDKEDFEISGAYLEALDKGYIKQVNGEWYISTAGKCVYMEWRLKGGVNYFKN